jgi:type I restriction-modification system DNA methylase subunit
MLLAAASVFPQWAVHRGLIEFYGQDIDPTCVAMAKVNLMLYGLNGERVRYALALSDAELGALPEPWAEMYAEAKRAKEDGDDGRVREIAEAVREGKRAQFERVPLPL